MFYGEKRDKRDSTTLTRKMLTGQVSPREPECRNILCFDEVGRSHRNAFASSFLAKKTNDYRRFIDVDEPLHLRMLEYMRLTVSCEFVFK